MWPVKLEPATPQSRVKHSTTELLSGAMIFSRKGLTKGADKPAHMCRLVCAFVVYICLVRRDRGTSTS